MRAADRIVEVMIRHGVRRVFGMPGGAISPIYDALHDTDVEVLAFAHEGLAGYVASGHAHASGRPGFLLVTSGPGVLNTMTAVAAASLDEIPLVVLAGDVPTTHTGRGALQDGGQASSDIVARFRGITRSCETITSAHGAAAAIERAIAAAMTPPCGPVLLRCPVDLLLAPAGACHVSIGAPPPSAVPPRDVAMIARALSQAKRPALMLGVGARQQRLGPAAVELAEWLRCPIFCDIEAKGLIPTRHPLSLGLFGVGSDGAATRYLQQADLVVTIGARLDDTSTAGYSPLLRPHEGLMYQLDHDALRLAKSYAPDAAIACNLGSALRQLRFECAPPDASLLLVRDRAVRAAWKARSRTQIAALDGAPFDPRGVVLALREAFGPDTIFTCDIGNHMLFAARHLEVHRPDGFHVAHGLAGMTSGIGTAIGIQLAHGRARRVVSICGDGGLLMSGSELATCAHYGIPVTYAVFNDGQLGMVRHGQKAVYGRGTEWTTPAVDLVAQATALGARGRRVERYADLVDAAKPTAGPMLLDIPIDPLIRPDNPRDEGFSHAKTATGSAG